MTGSICPESELSRSEDVKLRQNYLTEAGPRAYDKLQDFVSQPLHLLTDGDIIEKEVVQSRFLSTTEFNSVEDYSSSSVAVVCRVVSCRVVCRVSNLKDGIFSKRFELEG